MILHLILTPDNRVLGIANQAMTFTQEVDVTEATYNEIVENGHEGYFFENGSLVKKQSYLDDVMKNKNIDTFRTWRAIRLAKYDLLRQCALNGDIDPFTGQSYPAITEAEKQWRVAVLNFTDQITHETTEADYPVPPERMR